MRTRGRLSLAAVNTSPVERIERLPPPPHLSLDQRREWVAIVNTMPAEHFMRGNQGILEQYCCHMVAARELNKVIQLVQSGKYRPPKSARGRNPYNREKFLLSLFKQQKEESAIIRILLTSMRLTQQSIYRGETVKHPKGGAKQPWDD